MKPFNPRGGRRPLPSPDSQTLSRALPTQPAPASAGPGDVFNLTEPKTFITRPGAIIQLISAQQPWAKVTLTLETAGPVEVSSSSNWTFLNGQGQTLITNVPLEYFIAKGNNLYVQAGSAERVRFTLQPLPWLELITQSIRGGFGVLAKAIGALASAIRGGE